MKDSIDILNKVFMAGFYLGRRDAVYPVGKHEFQSILKDALNEALNDIQQLPAQKINPDASATPVI